MSLLTPLYVLGALAIAAPIVFHLIRKTPRGEVPFSSLMFLSPTPPRLTRRGRLDDWLLLLLRASALLLLALAFARPFLREAMALSADEGERRRVAILVDTSASMRRGNLWARAKELAEQAVAASRPNDELALFAFDDASRPVFTFAESATLDADRRKAVARARLDDLKPTWGATDLGQAIVDAVGAVEDLSDASERAGRMPRRIVLVTDLQQGSRLNALGAFEWPSGVDLELKAVADEGSNASLQLLNDPSADEADADGSIRVRVANDAASRREKFTVAWSDERNATVGKPVDAYVPAGESRVVRVPRATGKTSKLRLAGDQHGFDNAVFVAADDPEEATVLFVGDDAPDDTAGLLYFLSLVYEGAPGRNVSVRRSTSTEAIDLESGPAVPLVVTAGPLPQENAGRIKRYVEAGGTGLIVLRSPEQASSLAALAGVPQVAVEEANVDGDTMLGEITFDHPLFAPFAGPQFNDFTTIRFWKHRRVEAESLGEIRVPARFENGNPAVIEKALGKGRLVIFASGWNPSDSQLGRSSKFVPLMMTLLDRRDAKSSNTSNLLVHHPLPIPEADSEGEITIRKPNGTAVRPANGTAFTETDEPGVYAVEFAQGSRTLAVNLDPTEGKTSPLPSESLEQLGVRLANRQAEAVSPEQRRQMLNAELESRQKLWRWLILAAVGVLITETWLAGRLGRPRPAGGEAAAT